MLLFALGSFLNYRSSQIFSAAFFNGVSYASILTKMGLCYILGNSFKNSSGHPVRSQAHARLSTE
jgi:hypothetical protein